MNFMIVGKGKDNHSQFKLITQNKKKIFLSHSCARLPSEKVLISTSRSDSKTVKEVELSPSQADVFINQKIASSLNDNPDDITLPYMSMVSTQPDNKHVRERDVLVRLRVPETSMSWIEDKVSTVSSGVILDKETTFYPTNGNKNFYLAVLTLYPPESGFFATLKTEQGYTGLPMSHWMSVVPMWRRTKVKTEIAILIDNDAQARMPGIGKMSNKRGYTPLGVISGFFDGNMETCNQISVREELLSMSLFSDARCSSCPTEKSHFGFAFCMSGSHLRATA